MTVIATLQFVEDGAGLLRELTRPLVSGSHLGMAMGTAELAAGSSALAETCTRHGVPMCLRDRAGVEGLFPDGFDFVEPGVVPMDRSAAWSGGRRGRAGGDQHVRGDGPAALTHPRVEHRLPEHRLPAAYEESGFSPSRSVTQVWNSPMWCSLGTSTPPSR